MTFIWLRAPPPLFFWLVSLKCLCLPQAPHKFKTSDLGGGGGGYENYLKIDGYLLTQKNE